MKNWKLGHALSSHMFYPIRALERLTECEYEGRFYRKENYICFLGLPCWIRCTAVISGMSSPPSAVTIDWT